MEIKLRQIRKEKGLSIRQLEKLSKVSRSEISYIETGQRTPTIETLCKLSMAMDISIDSLIVCSNERFKL